MKTMPDLLNHEDNHFYAEVLTWLNRNMTSTFQRDTAAIMANALNTTAKQLVELPAASPMNTQLTFFQTLLQNTDPQQLKWRNFQIFLHEKLLEREANHQQMLCELRNKDWELIIAALAAFARNSPT